MSRCVWVAAVLATFIAACQGGGDVGYDDASYRCERIQGQDPGTAAFQACLVNEQLARRYRHP